MDHRAFSKIEVLQKEQAQDCGENMPSSDWDVACLKSLELKQGMDRDPVLRRGVWAHDPETHVKCTNVTHLFVSLWMPMKL